MNGLLRDFNFAARLNGQSKIFSTQMYLPMPDGRTTLANFFSPLVHNMEQMFLTGKTPYPIERTLLTTGLTDSRWKAFIEINRVSNPSAAIRYAGAARINFLENISADSP